MHVVCVVSDGDSPLKITWLKDGRPLNSTETTTHQIGNYDLALMIQSATTAHNGNYTCVASNDAAETSRTASLLVHGTQGRIRFSTPYGNRSFDPTISSPRLIDRDIPFYSLKKHRCRPITVIRVTFRLSFLLHILLRYTPFSRLVSISPKEPVRCE